MFDHLGRSIKNKSQRIKNKIKRRRGNKHERPRGTDDKIKRKRGITTWIKRSIAKISPKSMNSSTQDVPDTLDGGASSASLTDRVSGQAVRSTTPPPTLLQRSETRGEGSSRAGASGVSTRLDSNARRRSDPEQTFKETYLRELQARQPLTDRMKAARAVCGEVQMYSVETLVELWDAAEDLIAADSPKEARKAGFELLAASVEHSGLDAQERIKFFDIITRTFTPADSVIQLKALKGLTRNGHNLSPFEIPLAMAFNRWLQDVFEAALLARAAMKKNLALRANGQPGEEEGLILLLRLVTQIVKNSPETFQGVQLAVLVDRVIWICKKTTTRADIENGVDVIKAITAFSRIPSSCFEACIETLCAISCNVDTLGSATSLSTEQTLHNLLSSKDGSETVECLLRIMLEAPRDKRSNTVRGALAMVKRIVSSNGIGNLPIIGFKPLADALSNVFPVSTRLELDCLQTIGFLFDDQKILNTILHEDWEKLFSILQRSVTGLSSLEGGDAGSRHSEALSSTHSLAFTTVPIIRENRPNNRDVANELVHIAKVLESLWNSLDVPKQHLAAQFYWCMHLELKAPAFELLFSHLVNQRLCFPPAEQWVARFTTLVKLFLLDSSKPATTRCLVLEVAKEVHKAIHDYDDQRGYTNIVLLVLDRMKEEKNLLVINSLAEFLSMCTAEVDDVVFREVVAFLQSMAAVRDNTHSPASIEYRPTSASETTVNITTTCLVRLFLRCLEVSTIKTNKVHEALMTIASSQEFTTSSRLAAMKLLTRIRCDSDFAVIVIRVPDTQDLASALGRTEASVIAHGSEPSLLYRASLTDESQSARIGRSTSVNRPNPTTSRSGTRSASGLDTSARPTPLLWMYPGVNGLPEDPPNRASPHVRIYTNGPREESTLKLSVWLESMIGILQQGGDWEIYSYVLVHLPSQLSNPSLFAGAVPSIKMLRNVVCEQLQNGSFVEPPSKTGVKRSDVALCLFHTLSMLLGYHDHFARSEEDDIVRTFLAGIGSWDRTAKCSIHALAVCCHELPMSVARSLNLILQKMSQIITQTQLAMDTLEFLGGLARLPDVYVNLAEDELRVIFGICIRYLHHSREQRQNLASNPGIRTSHSSVRLSGTSADIATTSDADRSSDAHKDLPQYVFALAYHVITIWFLSLRLQDRSKHVGWITKSLAAKDDLGNEIMEEQSQVTLDMMHRTAYSDLGETVSNPMFTSTDGDVMKKSWLVGMSIVTVETAMSTGMSQLTKRQASGTTHAMYQQLTAPLPPHHVPAPTDVQSTFSGGTHPINVFPNHVFLQLASTIAPTPIPMQPVPLPEDDATKRAISTFDRNGTVDGHKVGFIYVGNNQASEAEILANTAGSEAYYNCLRGLGTGVRLKDAIFNTQGLDRESDMDGQHTYAWRDRITEIIFHVTTMMPTDTEQDAQCVNKKRHIGNDFVNIIYNDSGLPFRFETFPSQFNYVNITITPEALLLPREVPDETAQPKGGIVAEALDAEHGKYPEKQQYFKVQTLSAPSFPQISPAATPKLVSASALPAFVRQLALNASVFSLVWANREGGEHVSSWRNRLREIVKLRERFTAGGKATGGSKNDLYPEMGGAGKGKGKQHIYVDGDQWKGTLAMGGVAEEGGIVQGLDFSKWAT